MSYSTVNTSAGEPLKEYIIEPDLDDPESTLGGILKEVAPHHSIHFARMVSMVG